MQTRTSNGTCPSDVEASRVGVELTECTEPCDQKRASEDPAAWNGIDAAHVL